MAMLIHSRKDGSPFIVPVQEPQQPPAPKRQPALRPELREFLHMLKSLETELEPGKQTAR